MIGQSTLRALCLSAALAWAGSSSVALAAPKEAPSPYADISWRKVSDLPEGDQQVIQSFLSDIFGDDPDLWPDWLDLQATTLPPNQTNAPLVVRHPMRQACGPWGYIILTAVLDNGTRGRLGERFCANDLFVTPRRFQDIPDLQFDHQGLQDAEGNWSDDPARWRWNGRQWDKYKPLPLP